jgi:ABC-type Fe3+-siderophore transport system permease subunit
MKSLTKINKKNVVAVLIAIAVFIFFSYVYGKEILGLNPKQMKIMWLMVACLLSIATVSFSRHGLFSSKD